MTGVSGRRARGAMAEMAQRRRSLSRLLHRPHSDRGDAARHGGCRRIRVPGVSPPAAGALLARPRKAGPQPSAAGGGGGAVSLSLQLDRRRPCRIHVRDRPQGLDPLSAAALDLEGHRDLRRARRGVARDAARLARQQWRRRSAISISVSSAPSRASTARTGWKATTANTTIRSRSIAHGRSRAISKRRCSIPPQRRRCRSQAGRSRGWKRPIATTPWNMCGPPHP